MDHFHMYRGESQLHNLFTFARHSYIFIHGEQYTTEQQQDDLENYCALELIHQDYLFRYRIWRLSQRYQRGEPIHSELEILWREMNITQKVRGVFLRTTAHGVKRRLTYYLGVP